MLDVAGQVPPEVIRNLLTVCRSNIFHKVQEAVQDIILDGHSAQQVLLQLQQELLNEGSIQGTKKAAICEQLAVVDKGLVDGADEHLQLLHVMSEAQRILCA